ncbi:MAG TPA: S9 family peptidase [Candidatus Mcinerneyibacterium sp.]|nr:S9 family peptidase [Candidatus Mcinerneyibacterium sp.]
MKKLILLFAIVFFIGVFLNIFVIKITPPDVKKDKHVTKKHGHKLVDNYYWLRNKENKDVINYIKKENHYTKRKMRYTKEFQDKIYDEIIARIQETDLTVPYKFGDYYYYSRTEKGKNYRIYCRKKNSLDNKEEIILDVNKLAKNYDYYDVGFYEISPDHNLLAFSYDTDGSERYSLKIKNLKTGEYLEDQIDNIGSFEWVNDNQTFYYTVLDEAKRPHKLYRHKIGTEVKNDKLLFTENDDKYWMWVSSSKSRDYIFLGLGSKVTSEIHFVSADKPDDNFKLIKKREQGVEYYLDHHGDYFYIITNKNAINYKIMRTSVNNYREYNWETFIPHNKNVYITDFELFKNFMVVSERNNSYEKLKVINFDGKKTHYINFSEKVYTYWLGDNPDYDSNKLRLTYTSMVTPRTVYDYNMESKKLELKKKYKVNNYDKNNYKTERIFIKSHDGTEVPISLVYDKNLKLDGTNPLYLYGYGAYGSSMDPYFSYSRVSLLKRGFIFAMAHVRGGSEMGKKWYDDGKLLNKKNTFKDFIACAEKLIEKNYTSKDKLVISGGSAGGLLMGAVLNMRPDLFETAIVSVPFVDVINTMLDPTIPLTVPEYEEWGNPNEKKYFEYMLSYSPYDNIKKQDYPNILVTGGLNDPRVQYWEPVKYTAKLRDKKTDDNILLLKINMGSGHQGSSGRYDWYKEIAFDYAFIFKTLNLEMK